MKEHGRVVTKLIGEEISRLTEMARKIKEEEKNKPCSSDEVPMVPTERAMHYLDEENASEFWKATAKVWYDRLIKLRKQRNEAVEKWIDKYIELKRFKLANYSLAEIEAELARRKNK